jgi:hypothetical protein
MKTAFLFAAPCLLGATEASARTNWQGEAVVTAVNAACTWEGEAVGAIYKVMYMPSGLADNGPNSFMNFYGYRNAFSIQTSGRPVAKKSYSAIYINSYGKNSTQPPGTFPSLTQSPATLKVGTAFVTMRFQITNRGAMSGCTATLEAAMVRRR